jgi:hypothetical protein
MEVLVGMEVAMEVLVGRKVANGLSMVIQDLVLVATRVKATPISKAEAAGL